MNNKRIRSIRSAWWKILNASSGCQAKLESKQRG